MEVVIFDKFVELQKLQDFCLNNNVSLDILDSERVSDNIAKTNLKIFYSDRQQIQVILDDLIKEIPNLEIEADPPYKVTEVKIPITVEEIVVAKLSLDDFIYGDADKYKQHPYKIIKIEEGIYSVIEKITSKKLRTITSRLYDKGKIILQLK